MLTRRIPYEIDELETVHANQIRQLNFLKDRNKTFMGWWKNQFTNAQSERLELDGMIVKQILEHLRAHPMPKVRLQYIYSIPHDIVREWYALAFPKANGWKNQARVSIAVGPFIRSTHFGPAGFNG